VSGIGSLVSGILGSSAAKKAAQQQEAAAQAALGVSQKTAQDNIAYVGDQQAGQQANEQQAAQNLNPYLAAGSEVEPQLVQEAQAGAPGQTNATLQSLVQKGYQAPAPYVPPSPFVAPTAAEALANPAEQAELKLGEQAQEASAAAQGGLIGGGEAKSLAQYANTLAATNYQNVYSNALNAYQTNTNTGLNAYNTNAATGLNAYNANVNSLEGGVSSGNALYNTNLNALGQVANQGQTAAATNLAATGQLNSQIGQNTGTVVGSDLSTAQMATNALTGFGNAQSAGTIGSTNALTGGIAGLTNSLTGAALYNQIYNNSGFKTTSGSNPPASNPPALNGSSYGNAGQPGQPNG
jgi:hypothetical protein